MAGRSLPRFLLAATLARGVRYHGLAVLVMVFGERAEEVWERHTRKVWIGTALLLAAILAWTVCG